MKKSQDIKIAVKVTPNAKENAIIGMVDIGDGQKALKICVKAIPEDGKANQELISIISDHWKIPKSAIAIAVGGKSRLKIVTIAGEYSGLINIH